MTTKSKRSLAKAPEHERARYWRENIVNLSRRELAERIGISASRITDYERGHDRGSGEPIDQGTMSISGWLCPSTTAPPWNPWD